MPRCSTSHTRTPPAPLTYRASSSWPNAADEYAAPGWSKWARSPIDMPDTSKTWTRSVACVTASSGFVWAKATEAILVPMFGRDGLGRLVAREEPEHSVGPAGGEHDPSGETAIGGDAGP